MTFFISKVWANTILLHPGTMQSCSVPNVLFVRTMNVNKSNSLPPCVLSLDSQEDQELQAASCPSRPPSSTTRPPPPSSSSPAPDYQHRAPLTDPSELRPGKNVRLKRFQKFFVVKCFKGFITFFFLLLCM